MQYAGNGWLLGAMRCAVASIPEFPCAAWIWANWRAGGGTNADKRLPAPRAQNLFALYHHNVERSLLWDVHNVISMFRRFCNALDGTVRGCVNAGYFPRFMGSG